MANEEQIQRITQLTDSIMNVDQESLLRESLGDVGLHADFASGLETIRSKAMFARQYLHDVHQEHVENILAYFENILSELQAQAERSHPDYVANRAGFLDNINTYLEELKRDWAPLVTAAVESRGFLDDEGVRQEYERTIESMKNESENALQQVKEESKKTIEEARDLADQIVKQARTTAAGISVEEAQRQFREAQNALDRRVTMWACLSGLSAIVFLIVAAYFVTIDLADQSGWHVVYYSAIRVTILAAIGTAAAFCLKILRAHMHMSEKNRHRQRIANSMGAFVESAVTPEQRDMILSQLVESVVQFGNSGLIHREEDNMYRPKMTIDAITRTLLRNPQKE